MSEIADRLTAALADRYAIERELGVGGMATVYLAEDLRHQRKVAIKVLRPELAAVIGSDRFLAEIRTTANLQHPHILPLHDSGDVNGTVFYVMPFIAGESLRDRLNRETQLPVADAVRIASEIAGALDYAHRHGVIHRDIKPENILLHDGRAVVADFGIALAASRTDGSTRMTETGMSLGTPTYMSPEQAMGERVLDARTDIYALGCVLYEMLVGEPPFTGPSAQAIVAKVMTLDPPRADVTRKTVPLGVADTVQTALAKLPADRFSSAADFAVALTRESGVPRAARSAVGAASKRARGSMVAVGALLLAIGATGGWFVAQRRGGPTAVTSVRPLRLTNTGDVGCVAVSPDGKDYAAVVGSYTDETLCSGRLVVRPVPTGPEQTIAEDVSSVVGIEWSPKGTSLVLGGSVAGRNGIWILPRGSGQPRLLTSIATIGTAVGAFVDDANVSVNAGLDWRVLRLLDAESGDVRDSLVLRASERGNFARWSPSGQRLAISVGGKSPGVFLMTRKGQRTDSLPGNFGFDRIGWVGDRRLVYARRNKSGTGSDLMIRSVDAATGRFVGDERMLWASITAPVSFSASVAGDRILLVVGAIVDELHVLRVADGSASSRRLVRSLNAYLGNPQLSPDGTRAIYSHEDVLSNNAYWVSVAGGAEHVVSSDTVPVLFVDWVDATRVRVSQSDGAASMFDLETGRRRRVQSPAGFELIGAKVDTYLWRGTTDGAVLARDSTGRDLARAPIANQIASATAGDGSRVVLVGAAEDGGRQMSMFTRSAASWSTPRTLTPSDLWPAGIRGDGTVYWSRFTGQTEVWRSLGNAQPTRVATLPVHCYAQSVAVSEDGATLICNLTTQQPDAWLLQLPKP